MKFKVGDQVIVKKIDGICSSREGGFRTIAPKMYNFCGKVVTIEYVGKDYYHLREDGDKFYWDDGMFENIPFTTKTNIFVGKYKEFYVVIKEGHLVDNFFHSLEEISETYKDNTIIECK